MMQLSFQSDRGCGRKRMIVHKMLIISEKKLPIFSIVKGEIANPSEKLTAIHVPLQLRLLHRGLNAETISWVAARKLSKSSMSP